MLCIFVHNRRTYDRVFSVNTGAVVLIWHSLSSGVQLSMLIVFCAMTIDDDAQWLP